jgi:hypothetical protein
MSTPGQRRAPRVILGLAAVAFLAGIAAVAIVALLVQSVLG